MKDTDSGPQQAKGMGWIKRNPMVVALVATLVVLSAALFLSPFSGAIAGPALQIQPTPSPVMPRPRADVSSATVIIPQVEHDHVVASG